MRNVWNNYEPINSTWNKDIYIWWHNNSSITKKWSGDLEIGWNNNSSINSVWNGDIEIAWDNNGNINMEWRGDINIWQINNSLITVSWSWDIEINWNGTNWIVSGLNGDIAVNNNNFWWIVTKTGNIFINGDKLMLVRESIWWCSVNINMTWNIINTIISWNSIYGNWNKVTWNSTWSTNKIIVNNELEIDFTKHVIRYKWNLITFNWEYKIVWDFTLVWYQDDKDSILIMYKDQVILAKEDEIKVAYKALFNNSTTDFFKKEYLPNKGSNSETKGIKIVSKLN